MSKRVIFISLPTNGIPDEVVRANIERAKAAYLKIRGLDIENVAFVYNLDISDPPEWCNENKEVWLLGNSLMKLASCDECFFWIGWNNYKDCWLERNVCLQYGIPHIEINVSTNEKKEDLWE